MACSQIELDLKCIINITIIYYMKRFRSSSPGRFILAEFLCVDILHDDVDVECRFLFLRPPQVMQCHLLSIFMVDCFCAGSIVACQRTPTAVDLAVFFRIHQSTKPRDESICRKDSSQILLFRSKQQDTPLLNEDLIGGLVHFCRIRSRYLC